MTPQIQKPTSSLALCLGNNKIVACETFEQASKLIYDYISFNGIGSSAFYKKKNAGLIFHPSKGAFAHVSYNGRVWQGAEIFGLNRTEVTNLKTNNF